ncbi:MAG TPA: hypothetical protein VI854_09640 [Acidimicrobiia bacterium]|nr:hypothetical protein [Acidimicrobiia bacterium]
MSAIDSTSWLRWFESNRLGRPEPDWDRPCAEDAATAAKLARSLSHFQLGESGDGTFLLAEARRAHPGDADYVEALSRHWTHGCFRLLRRALGVQFEIQVLLTAELVKTAYYRLLHGHARDPVLLQVCDLLLADEARHVEFPLDRFTDWQSHWLPPGAGAVGRPAPGPLRGRRPRRLVGPPAGAGCGRCHANPVPAPGAGRVRRLPGGRQPRRRRSTYCRIPPWR